MTDLDPNTPSIARVYDYLLDGKDNFAVDRDVALKLLAVAPIAAEVMRENRQFLARAARWAAQNGIGQFIDLGCGMPTAPNPQQSAQAVAPDAHIGYVDTDAVVLAHLRELAAPGNPGVTVIDGDVREVAVILDAISPGIELSRPVCLTMRALLHFFTPTTRRTWSPATRPRSRPAAMLSVGRADGDEESRGFGTYSSAGAAQAYNHSVAEFTGSAAAMPRPGARRRRPRGLKARSNGCSSSGGTSLSAS